MIGLPERGIVWKQRQNGGVQVRMLGLVLAGFVVGMGAGAFLLYRSSSHGPAPAEVAPGGSESPALSESTRAVLARLGSPVELHFYSLLDPATVGQPLQAFAERAGKLLAQYEAESGGKLRLTSHNSPPEPSLQNAAMAHGLKAFNIDKGDACYLGVAVVGKGQKESLPELSLEWEQALESDLTRAIERVANPPSSQPVIKRDDTVALEALRRTVTNLDSVSVQEGTRRVQENALAEFSQVAKEMQARIKEAEQRLQTAQNSSSEAERQAALKELQQVRAEQLEKLQDIGLRAQTQTEALERLKAAGR